MRIVIDTNRIIAALIKEGTARDILFDPYFEFLTPDYTLVEIEEHIEELKEKTRLTGEEFKILMDFIFEDIKIVPSSDYGDFIDECKPLLHDPDDVAHLATYLATNAYGIWAHDAHFLTQKKVTVLTNIDMLILSGKANRSES